MASERSNEGRAEGAGRVYQAGGDQYITEHHHHPSGPAGPDSVRWPAVGRAPVVLRDRGDVMARLRAAVEPAAGGGAYVLHGLGGCGKTAVAHEAFRHATGVGGRVGLWVNSSDTASLRAGMLAVAADRGASDGELTAARGGLRPAADLVWDYLDHSEQPWFLVLDNADDPAVLRDGGWLRTSSRGTVLVTTRQAAAHWWPGAERLHLGVLPREDAARVLRDLAPEAGTDEEAAEVADRLGRLPLALTLAGGFLAHQVIDRWTLAEYGRNLAADPIELIDQGAEAAGGDARHLVSSTWELSLRALADGGLPEAVTLLRLLACLSGDPLPLSLLSGLELPRAEPALRGLLDQSLTELVPGRQVRCLRTHGVLLDSVARGVPAEQRAPLVAMAADRLLATLPEIPRRGAADERFSLLAPHAIALLRRAATWNVALEPATRAVLRLTTALHRAGDYTAALTLATEADSLAEPTLGPEHRLVLRVRERAARALRRAGRFEEAETLHRRVLADSERVLGADDPDTLECCLGLAQCLYRDDAVTEAVALIRRASAGRARVLGEDHVLTLLARHFLLAVWPGPELEAQVPHGAALLADCDRELGAGHQITLAARLNYGFALFHTGRHAEAAAVSRLSAEAHLAHYGVDHPLTLAARTQLGRVLVALGQRDEGVEHLEAVVAGRTRVLGPDHPWTGFTRTLLAGLRD
ncbi:tetratricopeptide repeat protein [Streptomyces hainanensis]|uniref:Tetratricopeptide repeat protein n=1 Tax=Streptomyces hainanensis TaxID=402648 RepID=A0A4V2Y2E0_9ACTN|nr:tetratricopeptide repeat protein [Streptomyces hainanensis]